MFLFFFLSFFMKEKNIQMSGADRLPIFPTRGALAMLKSRTTAATRGYGLLKRKADALQFRFRQILANLLTAKSVIGQAFKDAAFSLAEMRFVTGDLMTNSLILETVSENARTKLNSRDENIAGINVRVFEIYQDGTDAYEYAGLSRGGQQLSSVKEKFLNLLNLVVDLASLQTAFQTLDEVLKTTKIRVAAIERVVLPKLGKTFIYVISELEEIEREDFYRIKKLKEKNRLKAQREPETTPKTTTTKRVTKTKCICHE